MAYSAAAVSNTAIAFQKPITLQQGRALRDNPDEVRQANSGAPYVLQEWHPHDGATVGDGNAGLFYDFAVHGAVASVETPNWADGYEYMVKIEDISPSSATADNPFLCQVYPETTAAYTSGVAIDAFSSGGAANYLSAQVRFYAPRLAQTSILFDSISGVYLGTSISTVKSDAYLVSNTVAQKLLKAKFIFTEGNIDAGRMYLYHRKTFAR